ncbi:MAG: prepilin peptidase [Alphaproteobacteria bacterium]|nr:prepilin peptidase [Alphaproteobacteria bacterium]
MIFLMLFLTSVFVALGTGVLAAWSDVKGMIIPNRLSLIVFVAFFPAWAAAYGAGGGVFAPFLSHVMAFGLVLAMTMLLFFLRLFGGGDAKLASAYALWMGLSGLIPFLVNMTVFGGLVALFSFIIKKTRPFKKVSETSWIGRLQAGESKVAYGVPIVMAAFFSFYSKDYLSFHELVKFLSTDS